MKKKRAGIRPFPILTVLLGAAVLMEMVRLPEHQKSLENMQEALKSAESRYQAVQTENRELTNLIAECQSDEAIERIVRREYGYCWYGEIIYEVENLEEIEASLAAEDNGER